MGRQLIVLSIVIACTSACARKSGHEDSQSDEIYRLQVIHEFLGKELDFYSDAISLERSHQSSASEARAHGMQVVSLSDEDIEARIEYLRKTRSAIAARLASLALDRNEE